MPDTKRSLSALLTLLADNAIGAISAQDLRDMLVSVFSGGLEATSETVTTGDVTGVAGSLHVCTIAGLTANRNFTLPSANAGERCGVYIADGDDTHSLILIGSASQTINGGSAATEWSRVFIKGECVIFRCIAANTWMVEHDGRIPCAAKMYLGTTASNYFATANTHYNIPTDTVDYDNANIASTANDNFTIRRSGVYAVGGCFGSTETLGALDTLTGSVFDGTVAHAFHFGPSSQLGIHGLSFVSNVNLAVGATVAARGRFTASNNVDAFATTNIRVCNQHILEII